MAHYAAAAAASDVGRDGTWRGSSGDAAEWSLHREVDDVVAVIEAAPRREDSIVAVLGQPPRGTLTSLHQIHLGPCPGDRLCGYQELIERGV
jgi:hypothetical protein